MESGNTNTVLDIVHAATESNYDRNSELKAFDNTKDGVKGLVDAGITKIPRLFIDPPAHNLDNYTPKFSLPVIDLNGIDGDPTRHRETVEKVRDASEKWGFFQVVNHGIPLRVLEEMLKGVRNFHTQDIEVKKEWYPRKPTAWKRLIHNSNFNLYRSETTNWRDTFICPMAPIPPHPEELLEICRDILVEFSEQVRNLGCYLFELLSEALGLNKDHLNNLGCCEGLALVGHYYPACPQPELTHGTSRHSDPDFITVRLQDHIGGLQVVHQGQWVDVSPCPGALVVNVGDLLQLITNDKFISAEHRVLANHGGPRISVACIFYSGLRPTLKKYRPIEELLSEDDPPKYRVTTVKDFLLCCLDNNIYGKSALSHFKL